MGKRWRHLAKNSPTSRLRRLSDAFAFMSGSETPGESCFRTRQTTLQSAPPSWQESSTTPRNVKMIALSCDSVEDHLGWSKDVETFNARGGKEKKEMTFPIIADPERTLAVKFGMLDPDEIDAKGIPLPARAVFIVGADKKLKLSILY